MHAVIEAEMSPQGLREAGRWEDAEKAYRNHLTARGGDALAWSGLALSLLGLNRLAEAEAAARRAISLHAGLAEAWRALAQVLARCGSLADAAHAAEEALRLAPGWADGTATLAMIRFSAGRMGEAEALFNHALTARPDAAEALANHANLLAATGRIEPALIQARAAQSLKPWLPGPRLLEVRLLLETGRCTDAMAAARRGLAAIPDHPDLVVLLTEACRMAGDLSGALDTARDGTARHPRHAGLAAAYGTALLANRQWAVATDALHRSLELDPRQPAVRANLAAALAHQNRVSEAIGVLRTAIGESPGHVDMHLNLVTLLLRQQAMEEVLGILDALERKPALTIEQRAVIARDRGRALAALHRQTEALDALSRAWAFSPDLPGIAPLLAVLLVTGQRYDEAVAVARRGADGPDRTDPDLWWALGAALLIRNDSLPEAEKAMREALRLRPDSDFHIHLGNILYNLGKLDEAQLCYRRALARKPDHSEALCNSAVALKQTGETGQAIALLHRALAVRPGFHEAEATLGSAWLQRGDYVEATAIFRRLLAEKPDAVVLCNLGYALNQLRQPDEAITLLKQSLTLRPTFADAWNNLGNTLQSRGRPADAASSFLNAILLEPDRPEFYGNLANVLQPLGALDPAITAYHRALLLRPTFDDAFSNRGIALKRAHRLGEGAASLKTALALRPNSPEAWNNLGNVLQVLRRLPAAGIALQRALHLRPSLSEAHDNLLMTQLYQDGVTPEQLLAEHQRYGAAYAPAKPPALPATPRDPARRLRVGYISGDFRQHVASFFIEPLLRAHDPAHIETWCYSDTPRSDEVTTRLRGLTGQWHETRGLSHADLASRIRADGIDILVDLSGHSAHNRMIMFGLRPAPIQVTWLGYPATTGLPAMDYRIVDPVTDPEGTADAQASESLVRLRRGFLAYQPPADAPPVGPLPALSQGVITFGSFNNLSKVTDPVLILWAAVLRAVPGSRLLLKSRSLADPSVRGDIERVMAAHGVGPDRLRQEGWTRGLDEHWGAYNRMDIALDPFPYNGTTTTCEALWMGVPVITRLGGHHAARVGASLLARTGLLRLITTTDAAYVAAAAKLAADLPALDALRQGMRRRIDGSLLGDAPHFARAMEAAYRTMWTRWCEGRPPAPFTV